MQQLLGILLGTLCAGSASYCFGTLLFRRLNLNLERTEYIALAFVAGSACFSEIIFLLCSLGLARTEVFVALALLTALAVICTRRNANHAAFARLPSRRTWPFAVLFAAFGIV